MTDDTRSYGKQLLVSKITPRPPSKDCFACKVTGTGSALGAAAFVIYHTNYYPTKLSKITGRVVALGFVAMAIYRWNM